MSTLVEPLMPTALTCVEHFVVAIPINSTTSKFLEVVQSLQRPPVARSVLEQAQAVLLPARLAVQQATILEQEILLAAVVPPLVKSNCK
jgi:hypothetical protein